jgi:hypothetical protein
VSNLPREGQSRRRLDTCAPPFKICFSSLKTLQPSLSSE